MRKSETVSVNAVASGSEKGARKQGNKCYVCDSHGHFARECPSKVEQQEEKLQCYNCKGYGHMSRDCPSGDSYPHRRRKKRGRGRGRGAGRGGSRGMHELEENVADEYAQEFSHLSLCSLRIGSLTNRTRKRFVKFRFHDPVLLGTGAHYNKTARHKPELVEG